MRLRAALALSMLLLADGCNLFTGVGDLQFPCDMFTGTGCRSGQTCRFSPETLGSACAPLSPEAVGAYAGCAQNNECPGGHLCVSGICRKYCENPSHCGWADARCMPAEGQVFSTCSRSCDLISPASPRIGLQPCGGGTRCDVVTEAGEEYTDCVLATGTGFEDAPCEEHSDCQVGLYCQRNRCRRACDGSASTCRDGQRCGGFSAVARQEVGSCCTLPEGQRCDLVTDCGCGIEQTCRNVSDIPGGTACWPLDEAPLPPYAVCASFDDCPSRHSCLGGVCKMHCNTVDDCGSDGVLCLQVSNSPVQGWSYCVRGCDPMSPEMPNAGFASCGAGATCSIYSYGNDVASECRPVVEGTVAAYEACASASECPTSHSCLSGNCKPFCAVSEDCPGPDALCVARVELPGGQLIGVCPRSCDALAPTSPAAGFQPCGMGLGCTTFTDSCVRYFD